MSEEVDYEASDAEEDHEGEANSSTLGTAPPSEEAKAACSTSNSSSNVEGSSDIGNDTSEGKPRASSENELRTSNNVKKTTSKTIGARDEHTSSVVAEKAHATSVTIDKDSDFNIKSNDTKANDNKESSVADPTSTNPVSQDVTEERNGSDGYIKNHRNDQDEDDKDNNGTMDSAKESVKMTDTDHHIATETANKRSELREKREPKRQGDDDHGKARRDKSHRRRREKMESAEQKTSRRERRGYSNAPTPTVDPNASDDGRRGTKVKQSSSITPISDSNKRLREDPLRRDVYIPPSKRRLLEAEQQRMIEEKIKKSGTKEKDRKVDNRDEEGEEEEGIITNESNRAEKTSSSIMTNINKTSSFSLQEEQRKSWNALRKTIRGTINRLNEETIKPLIAKLFQDANLIRGRGILATSLIQASVTSPMYTPVYAALVAVINTKLPEVGELVVTRAISSFKQMYKRKDQRGTLAMISFLGHLMNQSVVHEFLALQMLTIFLEERTLTDASVEVALDLTRVVGQLLVDVSPSGLKAVMEQYRTILHEGYVSKRVQYKIEDVMKDRKQNFKDYPKVSKALDLVEEDDQITFEIGLDDEDENENGGEGKDSSNDKLDIFQFDPHYEENEEMWSKIKKEVLGDDDDEDEGSGEDDSNEASGDGDDDDNNEESENDEEGGDNNKAVTVVHDLSEQDLVNLRRTIYLTIMSSATFEECAHKLAKLNIPEGRESELVNMLIECCCQERTFLRYYGMIASRFCLLHPRWCEAFEASFKEQYQTIHRLETNKLRNVAKLFAHMFFTDSLPWTAFEIIHLNEDETTSSSRIFLKILVQEMANSMGMSKLRERFNDPDMQDVFGGMFPKGTNPRDTRYAINFFTSIGMGPLTDELREHLANAPKLILAQARAEAEARSKKLAEEEQKDNSDDDDDSSSSTSSSTSSSSSSSIVSSTTSTSSSSETSSTSSSRTYNYSSSPSSDRSIDSRKQKSRSRSYKRNVSSKERHSRYSRRRSDPSSSSEESTASASYSSRERDDRRRSSRTRDKRQDVGRRKDSHDGYSNYRRRETEKNTRSREGEGSRHNHESSRRDKGGRHNHEKSRRGEDNVNENDTHDDKNNGNHLNNNQNSQNSSYKEKGRISRSRHGDSRRHRQRRSRSYTPSSSDSYSSSSSESASHDDYKRKRRNDSSAGRQSRRRDDGSNRRSDKPPLKQIEISSSNNDSNDASSSKRRHREDSREREREPKRRRE